MIQASLLQYFTKKSDSCTDQSSLFSVVGNADSKASVHSSEAPRKKPKKSLSLGRRKSSKECSKNKLTRGQCGVVKKSKNLKSGSAKVEKASSTPVQAATTPTAHNAVQVKLITRNNVKRNLFGTSPVESDDAAISKSSPLPGINFSFHSPVRGEKIPDVVSIHDSVSSALHQLPPMGDSDTAAATDCNDDCFDKACTEDDQWLENVSTSAWEAKIDEADQEMDGAKAVRVLRRYIIQSVVTRQRIDLQNDDLQASTHIPRSSREIVLELKSVGCSSTHSSTSLCLLRDDWLNSELFAGNKIQLVGCCDDTPTQCHTHVIDNTPGRFVIVVPDLLVSATTMATATGCMRRAVLAELFKGTGGHEVMLLGSLLHQVFEQVLTSFHGDNSNITNMRDHVIQLIHNTVNTFPTYMSMYGVGVSQDRVIEKLLEYVPMLLDWVEQFMNHTLMPDRGEIEFRRTPSCREDDQWVKSCYVAVSGVHDIEECVWSPRFGLKGKIDATVEVKMHTIRRPRNPQSHLTQQESLEQFIVPLELKTGKMTHPLGSVDHRAQVMLYALMLSEHYEGETPGGLLYYLKAGHMVGVPAFDHEIRALVMMRNRLANYLYTCYTNRLPELLRYPHTCRYCPLLQYCCVFHKCVENGTTESSGLKELFEEHVQHITDEHKNFFQRWYHLACLEVQHCRHGSKEALWAQDTRNRKEHGFCIDQLTAGQTAKQPDGSIVQTLHCSDLSSVPVWGGESRFVVGEYVTISRQDGRGWAVATGYIKSLRSTEIDIIVNKSLANNNSVLYRLDISQSHVAIGNVMLSNLMSLITCHNERGHRLRQLIIDHVEPVFGDACYYDNSLVSNLNNGQKEAIQKVMSSKDYTMILGMPGTGKTLTIATLVRVLVSNGNSVLLASYTNTAIDNILLKLAQMGLDFLRLGSTHKVHPDLIGYTTAALVTEVSSLEDLNNILDSKPVVATTCLGTNHEVFRQRVFDYCIIDEASQVTLPVCLGAIQYASQCFVLVGDHYQLPPLVESDEARNNGLSVSLFQLLSTRHSSAVVYLWQQFRMNRDIMLLSNTLVYNHRMKCGSDDVAMATLNLNNWASIRNTLPDWLNHIMDPAQPVVFVNTDKLSADKQETKGSHDQIYNELEADMVAKLVTTLMKCGCHGDDIGVITPYRQQQYLIRSRLCSRDVKVSPAKLQPSEHTQFCGVEVFTVDRYQGRDKACVIVSFVRNNVTGNVGSLLSDMHRINVALTRGRHKLIMIGSHDTLKNAPPLAKLFTILTKHNMMYNITQPVNL